MNVTRDKLKEIIEEELNVLLGLEVPHALGIDIREGQSEPNTIISPNEELLRAAESAEDNSFVVTENLKEVVLMLRNNNLDQAKSKIGETINSISSIVDELNKFQNN